MLRSKWRSVSPPTLSRHLFRTVECLFISFLIHFVSVYVVKYLIKGGNKLKSPPSTSSNIILHFQSRSRSSVTVSQSSVSKFLDAYHPPDEICAVSSRALICGGLYLSSEFPELSPQPFVLPHPPFTLPLAVPQESFCTSSSTNSPF